MTSQKIIKFNKKTSDINKLVKLLLVGEVVAAPTETAYGLLSLAIDKKAVAKVYKIKGRELGKPCPIIISDLKTAKKYFYFGTKELILAEKFWPGPLTLVLKPRQNNWPKQIINKYGKVGVRVPGLVWLRKLLQAINLPLTATSANIAGQPTLYSYQKVVAALAPKKLKFIVTGVALKPKPTSTVVEFVKGELVIHRAGTIMGEKIIRSLF